MRQLSKTLVRLNLETRAFHADTDAPWLDLVAGDGPSRVDYIEHLTRCYGLDASVEAALAYTPHLTSFIDLHRRFRAGYIAEDLLNLGVRPVAVAAVPQAMIAPFANLAEALGWLYVHERSTLLHDTVRSALLERLPELAFATSCLRRNAGHVGVLWEELGEAIDQVARTTAIGDYIVTAAIDASRTTVHWHQRVDRARQRQVASP